MINWKDHIVSDQAILLGKPTIKGTILAVEFILERLATGWTEKELLENYPRLTEDSIKAVFAFTYDCMKDGLLYTPIRNK
ncbi:MAG: DUF433 domain-containing protein [Bacteroidota bacterium]